MIKNYFKIALNSLKRNPLYSSVTLFGISFTLMVLIFTTAVLQNELGSNAPMSKADDMVFLNMLKGVGYERIIEIKIDSTWVNGVYQFDSIRTEKINKANTNSETNSSLSWNLIKDKIKPMKTIQRASGYLSGVFIQIWNGDKKLKVQASYTDDDFWKIFDFQFKEGIPYTAESMNERVVVMTQDLAEEYFGSKPSYLNEYFDWGTNGRFKVIGVVETPKSSNSAVNNEMYIPLTFANKNNLEYDWGYFGSMDAVVEIAENSNHTEMENELNKLMNNLQPKDDLDEFSAVPKSNADVYAQTFMGYNDERNGNKLLKYIGIGLLFFLLIPILNLVHLNNSRVLERAGEIGVRKAFGAQTSDIFYQFLFENFIITLLGGLLGILLSYILLSIFNQYEWLGNTHLTIDANVALYAFLIIVLFSFLSGVLPSLRIANFNIVNALKHSKL